MWLRYPGRGMKYRGMKYSGIAEWEGLRVPYIDVGGMQTWHEVSGEGHPVLLLHGGFAAASSWFAQVPALVAAGFRVHVPERRGHAHTPDVPGPITYSIMADDTIAYLDQEVSGPAHLVGWSDGAVVALLVAQRRPDLAARLVLIGQYYNSGGKATGGMLDMLLQPSADAIGFLRTSYDDVSPDGPGHFPVVYEKLMHMIRTEPEIDLAELAGVQAPALVMQGDRDEVTVTHSAAVAEALPHGRLAVLPGRHLLPLESPEAVNALLLTFLRGGPPPPPWDQEAPVQ
jgi:pimeloyl-ACP methyl ester carboxylesterase